MDRASLKAEGKPFIGLGPDDPPGPAQLGIYDLITLRGDFWLDLLQSPFFLVHLFHTAFLNATAVYLTSVAGLIRA